MLLSSSRVDPQEQGVDRAPCARVGSGTSFVTGVVVHGAKLGRTIGFPTANIAIAGGGKPAYGIYASYVNLPDGRRLAAATNFGVRPTFSPPIELLEAHIFDFSESLYGRWISVELVHFLRGELKFTDIDSLVEQMQADCRSIRNLLNHPL